MGDILGNFATVLGGVGGILIGFAILALVFVVAFLPLLFWLRNPDRRERHTGLERFAASLNTPDEGYDDRIPLADDGERGRGQGVARSTAPPPDGESPFSGG